MNREEGIRITAYHIWEEEGRKCHGNDIEHWLKAETIWQEQNQPVKTIAEIESSVHHQQINATSTTKPSTMFSRPQNKKDQFSKRKA